jgi:hypothetical protein
VLLASEAAGRSPRVTDRTADTARAPGAARRHISLTRDGGVAIAYVIAGG